MNWKSICFIVSGAVIQAIGVALLKYGMGLQNANKIYRMAAFVLMAVGFPPYNLGLKKTKLSIAQPLFSTTLFLSCTLLSIIVLHEALGIVQIFGTVIILVGVVVVISADKSNVDKSKMNAIERME